MDFKYPKDAVDVLYNILSKEMHSQLFPRRMKKYLVIKLVETAYHASLLTEEGNQLNFKLALIEEERVYTGINEETTLFKFKEERELTVTELRHLALAVDFHTSLICVNKVDYSHGEQKINIWGVVSIGSNIKDFLHLKTGEANHLPPCLVVSSNSPGHIQLAKNIYPLVILKNSKISIVPKKLQVIPSAVMTLLEQGTLLFIKSSSEEEKEAHYLYDFIRKKYIEIFCRILIQLSLTSRGLIFLFIPNSEIDLINKNLHIKYSIECQRVFTLLKAYTDELSENPSLSEDILRKNNKLSDAILAICNTTSIDGALVMDNFFNVLGFGAEIITENTKVRKLFFPLGQNEKKFVVKEISEFGTRHRSAARFVKAVPNSIAFVISQDGDQKVMTNIDDKVFVWSNIIWDRLWETI